MERLCRMNGRIDGLSEEGGEKETVNISCVRLRIHNVSTLALIRLPSYHAIIRLVNLVNSPM